MARDLTETWVTITAARSLGLQTKQLQAAGVQTQEGKPRLYCLEDIWAKCGPLLYATLHKRYAKAEGEIDLSTVEGAKHFAEVQRGKKLELENKQTEGKLVNIGQLRVALDRRRKNESTIFDSLPHRLKQAVPNLPQAVLSVVVDTVNEARNMAAGVGADLDESEFADETLSG